MTGALRTYIEDALRKDFVRCYGRFAEDSYSLFTREDVDKFFAGLRKFLFDLGIPNDDNRYCTGRVMAGLCYAKSTHLSQNNRSTANIAVGQFDYWPDGGVHRHSIHVIPIENTPIEIVYLDPLKGVVALSPMERQSCEFWQFPV